MTGYDDETADDDNAANDQLTDRYIGGRYGWSNVTDTAEEAAEAVDMRRRRIPWS